MINSVTSLTNSIAKHGIHSIDTVFYRRIRLIGADHKTGLSQQRNIRSARIYRAPGIPRCVRVDANLAGGDKSTALMPPIPFFDATNHVRRVICPYNFVNGTGQAVTLHMHNSRHLPHVEVQTDEQRFSILDDFIR